jgi:GSH-dependent disulfide-bond oxidoreductase
MIDLYYWTTPNGHKITLFLEETGLPYTIKPINITKDEQFAPDFLKISPNNRIPAIVDHAPEDNQGPVSVFESGAILLYLAQKTGKFLSSDFRVRLQTLEWLFWQMGGLGPMAGQNHHFSNFAPEKIPYAIDRYVNETARLYGVLNKRLEQHAFVAGDQYSIADMACFPWVAAYTRQQINIQDFAHVKRWFDAIHQRPATQRAYKLSEDLNPKAPKLPPLV